MRPGLAARSACRTGKAEPAAALDSQAQYLRVPQAQSGPVKIPDGAPDEQYLYLSDILPTAYQAVAYADVPDGGTLAVLGLGPVGQMAVRIAGHLGVERVIGVDPVPERRAAAAQFGVRQRRLRRCARPDADDGDVRPEGAAADGQAHVRRWIDDLLPIVGDDRDPLGVRQFATHHLPLEDAAHGYQIFRDKAEGCLKVVLQP